MKKLFVTLFLIFGFLFAANYNANAQTKKRVQFARGANSAVVSGTIAGYKYIDYVLNIRAGQVLSLDLPSKSKVELVIFMPDGDNMPDAAGISGGTMQIDETGDYTVRVLMTRASARRKGATAAFTLKIKVEDMR